MAIKVIAGFRVGGTDPIDSRLIMTPDEMKNVKDSTMPEHYFTLCKDAGKDDDGKLFIYKKDTKDSEKSSVYGKFKEYVSEAKIETKYDDETKTLSI